MCINTCLKLVSEVIDSISTYYSDTEIILIGDFNAKVVTLNKVEENHIFLNAKVSEKRVSLHTKIDEKGKS